MHGWNQQTRSRQDLPVQTTKTCNIKQQNKKQLADKQTSNLHNVNKT